MPFESIYLDHQATTPVDPAVVTAMAPYWTSEFGNPHSNKHAFGWRADEAIVQAREEVANLIGALSNEIIFLSGATEANNLAILGPLLHRPGAGRNIVVSAIEHKCVLESARHLEHHGYELRKAPVGRSGHIDLDAISQLIDANTALVAVMLVNNEIGTVQPIAEIGAMTRDVGALLHCDAAQAATGLALDVDALGVDTLSLSSHKMYGPKGIGALFISQSIRAKLRPIIHGGGQEDGLRAGTQPTPLCVGFGAAARIMRETLDRDVDHMRRCRGIFIETLRSRLSDVKVNGADLRHPGHVSLTLSGIDSDNLIANLQPTVAISNGAACSSGIPEPSHVLRAIGLDAEATAQSIRLGFGRFNTETDAKRAAELIANEAEIIRASNRADFSWNNDAITR